MSWRQRVVAVLFAVTLIVTIGVSGGRYSYPTAGGTQQSVWLDPNAPEELLAARLNITSKAKTPLFR